MNMTAIDLRLLVAFEAVMVEGTISRAAKRLGVTQSAVSQSIAKLRDIVGDELFERTGHGVRPTPKANELACPISQALQILNSAFNPTDEFDPRHSDRRYQVAMYAAFAPFIVPRLYEALPRGSHISFVISANAPPELEAGLRFGRPELALLPRTAHGPGVRMQRVWEDDVVLIARRGHPMLTNGVTEKIYFQLDHVILTKCDCLDEQESLDYVFEQQGMKRKIVMAIPIASTLFDLVANTDLVAAARSRFVKVYGNGPDIEIHKLPTTWPRQSMSLLWHERYEADLGHRWLRDRMVDICKQI